jgi:hypothetical protein
MSGHEAQQPMKQSKPGSQPPAYPAATLAFYGPNDQYATKAVVTLVQSPEDTHVSVSQKWRTQEGDIRDDPGVRQQILEFMQLHAVKRVVLADRIIGCPHEEGLDYPQGEKCPLCPFWQTRDRWTGKPVEP